jgi:hypothetical protein
MFLLSVGSPKGFSDADRTAVEAVAEAGLAALAADIESSPVSLGPSLLGDTRLKTAMDGSLGGSVEPEEGLDLQGTFSQVAYETLLDDNPLMSVAIIDKNGKVEAKTGLEEQHFDELANMGAFKAAQGSPDSPRPFSVTLGGKLHAVKLSKKETSTSERRLVAIQAVDLSGGSFFRRVLHASPAGVVQDGKVLGEPIGGAKASDLTTVYQGHLDGIPSEGASQVFEFGEGSDTRLASMGRLPGPAGKSTVLVVISPNTLGATDTDLATAVNAAKASGGMGKLPWPIIIGVLVLGLALSFYLPHLESTGPLKRLAGEFRGLAEGSQHQIFHDTYGGKIGEVAAAAAAAHEAIRVAASDVALDDSDAMDFPENQEDKQPRRTRSTRSVRRGRGTRRSKKVESGSTPAAIELPDSPDEAPAIETHSHAPDAGPASGGEPAAPTLSDEATDASSAADFADSFKPGQSAAGAPAPTLTDEVEDSVPAALVDTPAPAPAPAATPAADSREAYYREIFEEFVTTKENAGESTAGFTYEKFAKKLRKNTADLMKRDGIKDVKFSVYIKDGKAALKAKVVKG